jgi:hypothetical protein
MGLPRSLAASLASSAARRRRSDGRSNLTAVGTNWQASLVTNQRGPVLSRRAQTRADAFAAAHRLLEDAEDRTWFNGEVVSVAVAQSEG